MSLSSYTHLYSIPGESYRSLHIYMCVGLIATMYIAYSLTALCNVHLYLYTSILKHISKDIDVGRGGQRVMLLSGFGWLNATAHRSRPPGGGGQPAPLRPLTEHTSY